MSNKRNSIVAWLSVMMLDPAVGAEQLTLDGALSIAFDRSPIIRVARHSLEISRRNLFPHRALIACCQSEARWSVGSRCGSTQPDRET